MCSNHVSDYEFLCEYRKAVGEIINLIPDDLSHIGKHNRGWLSGGFDEYLVNSEARYLRALNVIRNSESKNILDVGGFLAAFPLALSRCGYKVSIAEKFGYYNGALDDIANLLLANGVEVIDADFTDTAFSQIECLNRFDCVTCMAVAEHLAHTPKYLLENIRSALVAEGHLVFEVPNIAFWPRRFSFFFKGSTVHSPIEDVYHSSIPFTGHHREYTLHDARFVIESANYKIVSEETFNYSINTNKLFQIFKYLPAFLFNEWAELIIIDAIKHENS